MNCRRSFCTWPFFGVFLIHRINLSYKCFLLPLHKIRLFSKYVLALASLVFFEVWIILRWLGCPTSMKLLLYHPNGYAVQKLHSQDNLTQVNYKLKGGKYYFWEIWKVKMFSVKIAFYFFYFFLSKSKIKITILCASFKL